MLRARRPYFWKNLAVFTVLSSISFSVYMYTYSFLMQDDFGDIPIPPVSDEDLAKLQDDYKKGKIMGGK